MLYDTLYENLSANGQGHLTMAGQDVTTLAEQFGTPLLLMDENVIRMRCRTYLAAMKESFPAGSLPLYASKALSCKAMYRIMKEEGMGVDVSSPGELYTALKAGFPMERVYFHGNNKTDADIRMGIENGIGCFICDNADELTVINEEAGRHGVKQNVLLRVTPGIDPHTHEKINTGRIDSKFGAAIETGQAELLVNQALHSANVVLCGFHCHIGSQIFDHDPFCDAAMLMVAFLAEMKQKYEYEAEVLNLGGGMAVRYTADDPMIDYAANIRHVGKLVSKACADANIREPRILMEPGRSIVADSGITLYTVGGTKHIPGFRNYVSVDGGMTDNPRYTLYQSRYTVLPASRMNEPAAMDYTVAGRCCESGDLIQEGVALPELHRGDLLAVLTTGAYNYSMASNYNRVPRPAVVLLNQDGPRVAVRRETFEDLLLNDL